MDPVDPVALSIDVDRDGDLAALTPAGAIDIATASRLDDALTDAITRGVIRLVIDLHRVDFLDSSGLGVLIAADRHVRHRGGDVRLVTTDENILKKLKITGLDTVFDVYPSLGQARRGHP
ncbi:MAG: STAS domain-containing protein [Streptosporangiaceae bacterium]